MNFPATRLRRLRRTEAMRSLVRETHLNPGALIYPLFVCPGEKVRKEISSMPDVFNLSIDEAVKEAEACAALGIGGLLLCGLPAEKDEQATGAWADDGIVQTALRELKKNRKLDSLIQIADVCRCEYMSHGHCGIVARDRDHYQDENDSSTARAGQDRGVTGWRGPGHCGSVGHDGRPRSRHARCSRRGGPGTDSDPQLRLQI